MAPTGMGAYRTGMGKNPVSMESIAIETGCIAIRMGVFPLVSGMWPSELVDVPIWILAPPGRLRLPLIPILEHPKE